MKEDEAKYVERMGDTSTVWAHTLATAIIFLSCDIPVVLDNMMVQGSTGQYAYLA